MGFYFRKSLRLGPLRFNLSKSGVGTSTGIKGARVGAGPRGAYVAGGTGGIYFRENISKKSARRDGWDVLPLMYAELIAVTIVTVLVLLIIVR